MIFLDSNTAAVILEAIESGIDEIEVSLDIGISITRVSIAEMQVDKESLSKIVKDTDSIYFIDEEGIFKAAISSDHFYKLFPTGKGSAPALLIDGVLMHRIKDTDPIADAKSKAKLCARKGIDMLEICTGLGYSTIACLDHEIRSILTIEKESNVIQLAKLNPWSKRLFSDERVKMIEGDAIEQISKLSDRSVHAVLHDPPRFSMGSELYTSDFYSEIHRILKPKGVLYHYVGSPGSRYKKKDLQKGVMARLRRVGFRNPVRKDEALGVVAKK